MKKLIGILIYTPFFLLLIALSPLILLGYWCTELGHWLRDCMDQGWEWWSKEVLERIFR